MAIGPSFLSFASLSHMARRDDRRRAPLPESEPTQSALPHRHQRHATNRQPGESLRGVRRLSLQDARGRRRETTDSDGTTPTSILQAVRAVAYADALDQGCEGDCEKVASMARSLDPHHTCFFFPDTAIICSFFCFLEQHCMQCMRLLFHPFFFTPTCIPLPIVINTYIYPRHFQLLFSLS